MAVDETQSLHLEIDSQLSNTTLIAMAVRGLCSITVLSPVEINRLELCLVEVVNNAIEHAYGNESGHRVSVQIDVKKESITITVKDQGKAMSPEVLEENKEPELDLDSPESWLCSGRGLHIVKNLMDSVSYHSEDDTNRLVMTKQIRH